MAAIRSVILGILSGALELFPIIIKMIIKVLHMGVGIIYPRQTRRHKDYLETGLVSSALANRRQILDSSLHDMSRPQPMKFHKWWPHSECPMTQWHEKQIKSGLSTKFKIIEHRRECQAPFYHEYLIIHLDDGAVCRLERVGEGSRADALRQVGCKAYDIIQRLPRNTYNDEMLHKEPSELVIQIDFPRSFDLFDVLSICFSIQKTKKSSNYTLQRYNCYFLCLTVLTVLTRRIAEWKALDYKKGWKEVISKAVNKLRTTESNDAHDFIGFGICRLLDPSSLEPRKFILDSLHNQLRNYDRELTRPSHMIDDTLWYNDFESATYVNLSTAIDNAVTSALSGKSTLAANMKWLLSNDDRVEQDKIRLIYTSASPDVRPAFGRRSTGSVEPITAINGTWEMDDQASIKLILQAACTTTVQIIRDVILLQGNHSCNLFERINLLSRIQLAIYFFPGFLALRRIQLSKRLKWEDPEHEEIEEFSKNSRLYASLIVAHRVIQSLLGGAHDASLAILGLLIEQRDWAHCLKVCVGRTIKEEIKKQYLASGHVIVRTAARPVVSQMTVFDFQSFALERIQAHSQQVDSYGLAEASLVQEEIKITMEKVWKKVLYGNNGLEARFVQSGMGLEESDLVEDYRLEELFQANERPLYAYC